MKRKNQDDIDRLDDKREDLLRLAEKLGYSNKDREAYIREIMAQRQHGWEDRLKRWNELKEQLQRKWEERSGR